MGEMTSPRALEGFVASKEVPSALIAHGQKTSFLRQSLKSTEVVRRLDETDVLGVCKHMFVVWLRTLTREES